MEVIDGYTHCGVSKYEPIERLRQVMQAAGVARAVLVQHLGEFDNAYIGSIVQADPARFAGVCLVDHEAGDAIRTLEACKNSGHFRGVRLTSDSLAAAPDLWRAAAEMGLVIVLYAPSGMASCLEPLRRFLDRRGEARVVITHQGNPNPADPALAESRQALRLADYPGTFWQVSGMKMFCPYPHTTLADLVREALERFGRERLYWGSNYPVVGTGEDYVNDLRLFLERRLPLPADGLPHFVGGNARRLWFEQGSGVQNSILPG